MKFNQLRDFVAIAENGSIRAAARTLGLAQPAITRSIQDLEHSLGAQLFIRGARGVTLTPIGQKFLSRANIMLEEARRSREEVRQLSGSLDGELVVGLSIAGHLGILSQVLAPFTQRYPKVHLRIIEGFLPTLEADLVRGAVDLYVGPVVEDSQPAELIISPLFDNERVVIARKGHPLLGARDLTQLSSASWLTTSITHDANQELHALFTERGLPSPSLMGQCQSALSILTLLVHSDMLAMVPRDWIDSPLTRDLIEQIPINHRFSAPPIRLVQRAGLGLTPAGEYFVSLVQEVAVQLRKTRPSILTDNA